MFCCMQENRLNSGPSWLLKRVRRQEHPLFFTLPIHFAVTSSETQLMPTSGFVHIVDDDKAVRESVGDLLQSMDYQVSLYGSAAEFLNVELPDAPACLVLDVTACLAQVGWSFRNIWKRMNVSPPIILMTGFGDIPMSVRGMKLGAVDFSPSPYVNRTCLTPLAPQ